MVNVNIQSRVEEILSGYILNVSTFSDPVALTVEVISDLPVSYINFSMDGSPYNYAMDPPYALDSGAVNYFSTYRLLQVGQLIIEATPYLGEIAGITGTLVLEIVY